MPGVKADSLSRCRAHLLFQYLARFLPAVDRFIRWAGAVISASAALDSGQSMFTLSGNSPDAPDDSRRGLEVHLMSDTWARDDSGRQETEAERVDRNVSELIQELRVAGLGVQVLFGFLLALPFTTQFVRLSHNQRRLYLADVVLAAISVALLGGPVAFHRIVFRQHEKTQLLRAANVMAGSGLVAIALAVSGAVLLITSFVSAGIAASLLTLLVVLTFTFVWLVIPLLTRLKAHKGMQHSGVTSE